MTSFLTKCDLACILTNFRHFLLHKIADSG